MEYVSKYKKPNKLVVNERVAEGYEGWANHLQNENQISFRPEIEPQKRRPTCLEAHVPCFYARHWRPSPTASFTTAKWLYCSFVPQHHTIVKDWGYPSLLLWQGLKDDYRTYCDLICFSSKGSDEHDEMYLKFRDE